MTTQDQEDHRLAALTAGIKIFLGPASSDWYDRDTFYISSEDDSFFGMCESWHPKTNNADSFDLYNAIYRSLAEGCRKYIHLTNTLHDALMSGDSAAIREAIFNCAVEIGRDKEGK